MRDIGMKILIVIGAFVVLGFVFHIIGGILWFAMKFILPLALIIIAAKIISDFVSTRRR
ncbi:hypothetical protein [Enterococcus timonensis]|uniref:hypothetical protein n=1 Tax=Enterococcus timonensis TaxID=1852364 RepID=UPI00131A313B|nr:hypothetical protein [Enterococcus timonensis]